MNRKEFLQKLGFLGVGLTLAPSNLYSSNSSTRTFKLPEPQIHIPHGNFGATQTKTLYIKDLNVSCSVESFMRNGIAPDNLDVEIYHFQKGTELLTISIARNGNRTVIGKIDNMQIHINSFGTKHFQAKHI